MLYSSAMDDNELKFGQSKMPLCRLTRSSGHGPYPLKRFLAPLDCEACSFQVKEQKRDGLYSFLALLTDRSLLLLLVVEHPGLVENTVVTSIFLI